MRKSRAIHRAAAHPGRDDQPVEGDIASRNVDKCQAHQKGTSTGRGALWRWLVSVREGAKGTDLATDRGLLGSSVFISGRTVQPVIGLKL